VLRWFNVEDWKKGLALVILWAYAYQLIGWPLWFNVITWLNSVYSLGLPAPVIVPWEQLATGTATLATVGGLQKWGERNAAVDGQHRAGGTD
jgi:hypothetical protein